MPTRAPKVSPAGKAPSRGLSPRAVGDLLFHARASNADLQLEAVPLGVTLPRVLREAEARDEEELAARLLSAWSDTVRAHVEAGTHDVSLSGGVDSAALCAMAARHAPQKVRAWTMDVHFADAVERSNARRMAKVTGAELVDVLIPDSVLPDLFEHAVLANQTVILNARAVASYVFYLEAQRQGAGPVLLSGAGADEVLQGTPGVLAAAKARVDEDRTLAVRALGFEAMAAVDNLRAPFRAGSRDHEEPPGAARGAVDNSGSPLDGAPHGDQESKPSTGHFPSGNGGSDQALGRREDSTPVDNLRTVSEGWNSDHVSRGPPVDNLGTGLAAPWELPQEEALPSEELRYAKWVLAELILPPELRGARAHGLTVRTPYLDEGFARVALALPESVLQRDGFGKWLFRHAVRSLVPDEVRLARKTPRYGHTALSSPVRSRWLELYRAWLSPARLDSLQVINTQGVLGLMERYFRLPPDDAQAGPMDRLLMRLMSLAMLQAHTKAPP
ncbi:putative asparagine synthetase [Corallococcus coralloides DSM 2259]|uniref:asparagine synthase (glutamine-hydrolyzing) n=1 Tax=Corallococcus coralloides (strain ATCC 25202 / DSM 2259 / NBRC 100086 / M2) TaxID=1144275 RepID=H8MT96_CORCM|nr:asparagine synthase C-terminal domain-containing protein [Corallococcus coralloides]AFE07713.1 putative asparagine synthetase [Corallococcus coralloides DSM 2259]